MFSSNDLYVFGTEPQLHVIKIVSGLDKPAGIAVGDGGRKLCLQDGICPGFRHVHADAGGRAHPGRPHAEQPGVLAQF
jgi:hypothetical protein